MARSDSQNIDGLILPEEGGRSLVLTYLKIVFIPVLIYLFFLAGYLKFISLKVEIHSILMMTILLFIALIFARHNGEMGCCIFERKISRFKVELKEYIMSHLLAVGNRKKSNAPFDSFAENFINDLRNDNYANVAAGVFPMLGILGTFISIALSMPNFSSSNINALESEIAQLLGGVGTAFYISIFGIFLALWWIYFEKKGVSKFEALLYRYKSATKEFFWDKDEISQSLLLEILNRNEKVADNFERIFNTEFHDNLVNSMNENHKTFKDMIEFQTDALDVTKARLNDSVMVFNTLEKSSQDLMARYENTLNLLDSVISKTSSSYGNLADQLDRVVSTNEKTKTGFEDGMSRVVDELANLRALLSDTNRQILTIQKESSRSFKEAVENSSNEIREAFKDFNSNDALARELKRSLDSIDKESKAIIDRIEKDRYESR